MCSERKEGSKRMKENPKNTTRSKKNVVENMQVKVRQEEDLNDLTSSVMHGFISSEVD